MFIVQNDLRPGEIQNALFDLMRPGIEDVRVCSAYVSLSGSQILFDGITRAAPNGNHAGVRKTIITSLDFGLTDPMALQFWQDAENSRVLVSGASLLQQRNLIPCACFHPKFYVFGRPDGTVGSLVGSANLTNRGLTVNAEVAWLQMEHRQPDDLNRAWDAAVQPAIPLTREILEAYRALRVRAAPRHPTEELEPLPPPQIGPLGQYVPFGDAHIDPGDYNQMWVQSRGLQGGAQTQLELPRRSHRFFGARYAGYAFNHVDHIAEPVLVSGHRLWRDRPLTWHGDNAMERINLPSLAMGGFNYANSLILFRKIAPNTFELRVHPWDSDSARAYLEASQRAQLVFRVGQNSNRLAGFIA
jgi:HKD family nuclease